jgi:MFS family permease
MLLVPVGIYVFSYFHRIAPAVVVADVMAAFAVTAATVGLLTAVYPWLFTAMALPAGSLADTLGPRWTLTAGGTLMATGSALFGLAPTFAWAFAGRLLVGLGSSVILIAWLRLGTAWCRPGENARLAGLSQTVGSLGGLAGTAPLALLVASVGWRSSFVAIGVATALMTLACALAIRDRPEALGLPPISPSPPGRPGLSEVLRGARAVIANPRSWPPVLVGAGVNGTLITFVGLWGVPYVSQVYGVPRLEASRVTAWAVIGVVGGAVSIGWLSDRVLRQRRLPMIAGSLAYAALWCLLALPPALRLPGAWLGPVCLALGFSSGVVALTFAAVPEVNDPARPGAALGFCNVPGFGAMALLQWLTGALLDAGWAGGIAAGARVYPPEAYQRVFVVCAAVAVGAAAVAWRVTETRCRNVWAAGTARP